jgi:hypothetical protein
MLFWSKMSGADSYGSIQKYPKWPAKWSQNGQSVWYDVINDRMYPYHIA